MTDDRVRQRGNRPKLKATGPGPAGCRQVAQEGQALGLSPGQAPEDSPAVRGPGHRRSSPFIEEAARQAAGGFWVGAGAWGSPQGSEDAPFQPKAGKAEAEERTAGQGLRQLSSGKGRGSGRLWAAGAQGAGPGLGLPEKGRAIRGDGGTAGRRLEAGFPEEQG